MEDGLEKARSAYDTLWTHVSEARPQRRLAAAIDLILAGKLGEVSRLYDEVIATEREELSKRKGALAEVLYQRGRLHQLKFQQPEALAMFEEAIALEPDNAEYLIAAGNEVEYSDSRKAEAYLSRAVKAYRRKPQGSELELARGLQHLGNLAMGRRQLADGLQAWIEAIQLLRLVVKRFPEWNRYLANLLIPTGNILGAGHPEGGEELLHEAIEILSKEPDVHAEVDALFARMLVGQLHRVHGRDDAVAIYGDVISRGEKLIDSIVDGNLRYNLLTLPSQPDSRRSSSRNTWHDPG